MFPSPPVSGLGGVSGALSLVGRLFLVTAGAYLLRALTEASTFSPALGVFLGLAYASLWFGAADRAAAAGRLWSSVFHGAAASLTAFPLVWEATTRFRILPTPWHILLLAAIACRRRALLGGDSQFQLRPFEEQHSQGQGQTQYDSSQHRVLERKRRSTNPAKRTPRTGGPETPGSPVHSPATLRCAARALCG